MWNCAHFRHPTDEQLKHLKQMMNSWNVETFFSNHYNLQSVYFFRQWRSGKPFSKLAFGGEILFHRPWEAGWSYNISIIKQLYGPCWKFYTSYFVFPCKRCWEFEVIEEKSTKPKSLLSVLLQRDQIWRLKVKGQSHELCMCGPKLKTFKIDPAKKKMAAARGRGGHGGKRRNSGRKKTISYLKQCKRESFKNPQRTFL